MRKTRLLLMKKNNNNKTMKKVMKTIVDVYKLSSTIFSHIDKI